MTSISEQQNTHNDNCPSSSVGMNSWQVRQFLAYPGCRYFPEANEPDIAFAEYLLDSISPESQALSDLPTLDLDIIAYSFHTPALAYSSYASELRTELNSFIDYRDRLLHKEIWAAFKTMGRDICLETSPQDISDAITKYLMYESIFATVYMLVLYIEALEHNDVFPIRDLDSTYKKRHRDGIVEAIGLVRDIAMKSGFTDYDDIVEALILETDVEDDDVASRESSKRNKHMVSVPFDTWCRFYEIVVLVARAASRVGSATAMEGYEERGVIEDCAALVAGVPFADVAGK